MNAQFIRQALEHAPAQPATPPPANLRGHWLKGDDGLYYVCSHCAGRMIARGVSLGRDAEPVWKDRPQAYGVCSGCDC
jgi:hypothetical protein